MVQPLPREAGPFLDQLATKVKKIEQLGIKATQMSLVCHNTGRAPVPFGESIIIGHFLWQARILANQCTLKYPRKTIVDNKVSISLEIIEAVNNQNGEYKIDYAKFGSQVTPQNMHDWIHVMCDETGSRGKHKSYLFMGQGHANYSKPEYTDTFERCVTTETKASAKVMQSGKQLDVYPTMNYLHTGQPAKLEKVYANADYDIAKFANTIGIVTMREFYQKQQKMQWLCSMSIITHKIDKFKEKGPTTQVAVQQRDWCLSWLKRNGQTAALKEYSLKWPTHPVEIHIKLDVNKEPAPVFGGGGYGASDKGPHVIVDDDSGDEKKGSSFARTTPTVKIEPRADAHVNEKVGQADIHAGKLMDAGFDFQDVMDSHDEYGSNYPARLKFCKASREKKRSRTESGDGWGASGGSHAKGKSSKPDWRFEWDHQKRD